jgi:hypothetical protein
MQQLRDEVAALKQQHEAEQQQLSERLMESVNQKQVRAVCYKGLLQGTRCMLDARPNPKVPGSSCSLLCASMLYRACSNNHASATATCLPYILLLLLACLWHRQFLARAAAQGDHAAGRLVCHCNNCKPCLVAMPVPDVIACTFC